jgi:nuclear pore complex protein Nup205
MVMKLFNDTRQDLSDILYMWSAQSSLPSTVMFRLLSLLQKRQPESEVGEGNPDKVTLGLIMAFLNSINLSPLHSREDGEGKNKLIIKVIHVLLFICFLYCLL